MINKLFPLCSYLFTLILAECACICLENLNDLVFLLNFKLSNYNDAFLSACSASSPPSSLPRSANRLKTDHGARL